MKGIIVAFGVVLMFTTGVIDVPVYGASSTTWKFNKTTKTWTVKTKKIKSTLELIDSLKKKRQRRYKKR